MSKKIILVSIIFILAFSIIGYAAVDTSVGWHPLQQVSTDAAGTTSVDETGGVGGTPNDIIDNADYASNSGMLDGLDSTNFCWSDGTNCLPLTGGVTSIGPVAGPALAGDVYLVGGGLVNSITSDALSNQITITSRAPYLYEVQKSGGGSVDTDINDKIDNADLADLATNADNLLYSTVYRNGDYFLDLENQACSGPAPCLTNLDVASAVDSDYLDGMDSTDFCYTTGTNCPLGGGATPDLQAVTDVGATTTQGITTGGLTTTGSVTANTLTLSDWLVANGAVYIGSFATSRSIIENSGFNGDLYLKTGISSGQQTGLSIDADQDVYIPDRLGIGIQPAANDYKLEIDYSAGGNGVRVYGGRYTSGLNLQGIDTYSPNLRFRTTSGNRYIRTEGTTLKILDSSANSKAVFENDGSVGIGTETTSAMLDVAGDAAFGITNKIKIYDQPFDSPTIESQANLDIYAPNRISVQSGSDSLENYANPGVYLNFLQPSDSVLIRGDVSIGPSSADTNSGVLRGGCWQYTITDPTGDGAYGTISESYIIDLCGEGCFMNIFARDPYFSTIPGYGSITNVDMKASVFMYDQTSKVFFIRFMGGESGSADPVDDGVNADSTHEPILPAYRTSDATELTLCTFSDSDTNLFTNPSDAGTDFSLSINPAYSAVNYKCTLNICPFGFASW